MRQPIFQGERAPRGELIRRLDRAFGQLNIFLAALAIGLAILDLTCLYAVTVGRPLATAFHTEMPQNFAWPALVPAARQAADEDSG